MFSRLALERRQAWLYLAGILAGLTLGIQAPSVGPLFDTLLWPVLGVLLYTTFVQVPLLHLRDAFRDLRFVLALLLGNFVLIPLLAWGLVLLLPDDPALRLGVLLVLLVPCTDWFITFTQLGRGDTARAIAVTPDRKNALALPLRSRRSPKSDRLLGPYLSARQKTVL